MFKVSPPVLFANACSKTKTPLFDGRVDDLLIKLLPLFSQMHHELSDVMNADAIHPLFQYAPFVIVDRTEIGPVG